EQVMAGTLGLDAAYAIARERKAAREGEAAQAQRLAERHEELRRRAPELADLMIKGTLTLAGAAWRVGWPATVRGGATGGRRPAAVRRPCPVEIGAGTRERA
ncbi:MAG TPA: hypothetical protein VFA70_14360, partial [Dehalococcoidia bacterium]|nr:hypothetical protein [Dehalococcoidia bacterium]